MNGALSEFSARLKEQIANMEPIFRAPSFSPSAGNPLSLNGGSRRLLDSFEVLAAIVRENTERTYATISRSITFYVSVAFATGFTFGLTFGVLLQRRLQDRSKALEEEIKAIREELAQRGIGVGVGSAPRKSTARIPVTFEAYFDDEEDKDEFYEALSALSRQAKANNMSPLTSLYLGRVEPASLIELTTSRVDALQARRSCASSLKTFTQFFLAAQRGVFQVCLDRG